jgi:surface antigen
MLSHFKTGFALLAFAVTAVPASAIPFPEPAARDYWQCVPFARAISGVSIFGDAHTWWGQAEGRYSRGSRPRTGAVLAFVPHNGMQLGHVAVVSGIIDARTITITHANWSLINGTRGQIERNVSVRDVSEAGDWSTVRVWYAPLGDLGTTQWPVHGFIYPSSIAESTHTASAAKPRLTYTSLATLDRKVLQGAPMRTTRLSYLGKILPRLAAAQ